MSLSNYPPGVTGNEWQIVGPDDIEHCIECGRPTGCHTEQGLWDIHYSDEFCSKWCEYKFGAREMRHDEPRFNQEWKWMHSMGTAYWAFGIPLPANQQDYIMAALDWSYTLEVR